MTRRRLPQRRAAVAFAFNHGGFRANVGLYPEGGIAELFLNSSKPDSTLDGFAADAAILISLLLQHGATPAEIGHALRRAPDSSPDSLIGAAIDQLQTLAGAAQ
jgi:hypothetical protein